MDTPRYAPQGNTGYVQTAVWWWSTADSAKAITKQPVSPDTLIFNSHGIRIKSTSHSKASMPHWPKIKTSRSDLNWSETGQERLMVRNLPTPAKRFWKILKVRKCCFRLTVKAQWNKFFGCFDAFYVTLYVMPASHSKECQRHSWIRLLLPASLTLYNTLFGIFFPYFRILNGQTQTKEIQ